MGQFRLVWLLSKCWLNLRDDSASTTIAWVWVTDLIIGFWLTAHSVNRPCFDKKISQFFVYLSYLLFIFSKPHEINSVFCPYTAEYGSVKARILAYFMQWICGAVSSKIVSMLVSMLKVSVSTMHLSLFDF